MRSALATLALLPASALALTITGPSATSFWVQNTSNVITWTFNSGDPSPVDIQVVNSNVSTLNGAFSIAQGVPTSTETITVTNVTLKVGDGFTVQFVNPLNASDVYASSNTFSVDPPGTAPAPTSSSPSSTSATNSSSASSASSTSPSSSSGSSTSGAPAATKSSGAAPRSIGSSDVFSLIAACGIASLTAMLL